MKLLKNLLPISRLVGATVLLFFNMGASLAYAGEADRSLYKVEYAASLGEISVRLYRTTKNWKKIAEWNNLEPPYLLKQGSQLTLYEKPKLSREEGNRAVYEMWRMLLEKNKGGSKAKQKAVEAVVLKNEDVLEAQKKAEEEKKLAEKFKVTQIQAITSGELENPDEHELAEEDLLSQATAALKGKDYEKAYLLFLKLIKSNKERTEGWFGAIRALRLMKREDEAKKLALELLQDKPELKELPFFIGFFEAEAGL